MSLDLKEYSRIIRVTDGASGTQLHRKGLPPGKAPEAWNAENAQAVQSVTDSYFQAGADIILTNTLNANRFALAGYGLGEQAAKLAEAGAMIGRRAADAHKDVLTASGRKANAADLMVFASVGPTGKIVMMEEVSSEALSAAFCETAEAVAFGGADAIVLESFTELAELRIALQACRQTVDIPVIACMTFGAGPDKTSTMMGDTPAALAKLALCEGAAAVGANCGVGPDSYVQVARMLRQACDLPVWIKSNAGLPYTENGETRFPMGPQEFASYVPKLIEAGANFIGGCCGTSPAHIEAVRQAVDAAK